MSFRDLSCGLVDRLIQLFDSEDSDELKNITAFTLGYVVMGNSGQYLPKLLHIIRSKNQLTPLISLKEVLCYSSSLSEIAPELWNILFQKAIQVDLDDSSRHLLSDCIGKTALQDPPRFFPDLYCKLSNENVNVKSVAINALKHVFTITSTDISFMAQSERLFQGFVQSLSDPEIVKVFLLILDRK